MLTMGAVGCAPSSEAERLSDRSESDRLGQTGTNVHITQDVLAACQQMSEQLAALHEVGKFNGMAVVAQGEDVKCLSSEGYALVFEKAPFVEETRFRIASVTKQFTAAVILKLWENDEIDLDGTVAQYLPEFAGKPAANVTIRHLLSHTSGIVPNIEYGERWIDVRREPEKLAQAFWDAPLAFEPGSAFEYSNSGYHLLGLIIERVSGFDYGTAIDRFLLKPLGLENSGTAGRGEIVEGLAAGYYLEDGDLVRYDEYEDGQPYAAGMMYSTVGDLVSWNVALYGGRVFERQETLAEMVAPRIEFPDTQGWDIPNAAGRPTAAYGLFNGVDKGSGLRWITHNGEFGSYITENRYFEERRLSMVIFENVYWGEGAGELRASIEVVSAAAANLDVHEE